MKKYTLKELRNMVRHGIVIDLTKSTIEEIKAYKDEEEGFDQVGFSSGVYGCNGKVMQGRKSKEWYVVVGNSRNIYVV